MSGWNGLSEYGENMITASMRNIHTGNLLVKLGFFALVIFLMIVFGLASAIFPWWFVLVILLFPLAFVAALSIPEVGVVTMLVLVCGLVPDRLSPSINLGVGTVKAHEIFIVLMLCMAFVRKASISGLQPYLRWLMPVFVLLGLVVSGALVAWLMFGAAPREILSDARNFLGWLILFCILGLIRTHKQFSRLQKGIVLLGLLVAGAALLQFFTGRSFVQNARVEELVTLNQSSDVVRSIVGAGNYFLIFSLFLLLSRMMTATVSAAAAVPLIAFLVAGLVVNFGRGIWLATFGGAILLAFWLTGWKGVVRIVLASIVGLAIALGSLALYKPQVIEASYDRLVSTTSETLNRNTTLGWRLEEINAAVARIASSPIVGIGVGTAYKPLIKMNGMVATESDEVLTRYIHNAYIGLWLKFGFLAPIAVFVLIWSVMKRGLAMSRQTSDPKLRALSLTIVAGFLVPVVTSNTQPEWLNQTGIAFFATMLALQIIAHRMIHFGEPEKTSFGISKMRHWARAGS